MSVYVCESLVNATNIYGGHDCETWVLQETQPSLLEQLAITPSQAGEITVVICSVLILGWVFGEIGSFLKSMVK